LHTASWRRWRNGIAWRSNRKLIASRSGVIHLLCEYTASPARRRPLWRLTVENFARFAAETNSNEPCASHRMVAAELAGRACASIPSFTVTPLRASRTAVLVCQARAVADGRLAVGRFADPVAVRMLRPDEQAEVELARGPVPRGWSGRMTYEFLTATAEILATRTVIIDDAVRQGGHAQVVILGAGLDGRAWRMPELAGTTVYEVDQPASQQDKRERIGRLDAAVGSVVFVPVEFGRDKLADALAAAGFDRSTPSTWIWEGVLPYLTAAQVDQTLADVRRSSAPGSQLIATYSTKLAINGVGRFALKLLFRTAGWRSPMANEPHISAWSVEQMRVLLAGHGMTVTTDVDQLSLARELGIIPKRSEHHARSRVLVAQVGAAPI
jgi:methyltransferase (TIGR00027 family)